MHRFLGITREAQFSPGRVQDDAAILHLVAQHLRDDGHVVVACNGDDLQWPQPADGTVVFTMCQGEPALARLRQWAARGVHIVNSPSGIENCQRHRTVPLLARADIAFPPSLLVDTAEATGLPDWVDGEKVWLKRGDVHATDPHDVVAVEGDAAFGAALERLRGRGIQGAIIQRHVPGLVLKFYGVRGRFFYCVPPVNGGILSPDMADRVEAIGRRAAQALEVEVYGGDCVYGSDGSVVLIDLNDWPSYLRCRAAAAAAIAAYLKSTATEIA